MIRSLDLAALRAEMQGWLASPPADFRAELSRWAEANAVAIT